MILHIARREWLEQRRHPATLGVCAALLALIALLSTSAVGMLQLLDGLTDAEPALAGLLGGPEAARAFRQLAVEGSLTAWNFLVFSQYLGFVGVMAGHGLLHDRQVGTLPFLLLAPVPRHVLLGGKVLGALGPLTAIYLVMSVGFGFALLALPVTAAYPELGPRAPAWWAAVLLGGPVWGAAVAMVAATVSAVARDVRLAQQSAWFAIFFAQLLVAFLITGSLGAPARLAGAILLGAFATAVGWAIGSAVLQHDLGR